MSDDQKYFDAILTRAMVSFYMERLSDPPPPERSWHDLSDEEQKVYMDRARLLFNEFLENTSE